MGNALADKKWQQPRARIGLIIPSANTLAEPQFFRYSPRDIEMHFARNRIRLDRSLLEQLPEILDAASLVADSRPDMIVYHCTGISMGSGSAEEARMVHAIRESTGISATSTATAIVNAFRALNARRVVLVTPYPQYINGLEKRFLSEYEIEVLRDCALDLPVPEGMCGAPSDVWIENTMKMRDSAADAYFLSCTNIQSLDAIVELERRLGRPVVTSNQAALWYAFRRCALQDNIEDLGHLFRLPLPTDAQSERLAA